MSLAARDVLSTLMRRCVECPNETPQCPPSCPAGQTCSLIPATCNACASTTCVATNQFQGSISEPKASTPVGPIVGGVIGGVAAVSILAFCVWFFMFRQKKRKDTWDPPEKRDQSTLSRNNGSRTHSIASTVLTRASNVIQIAYIPGVTGRSPPVSPGVPPMPTMSGYSTNNNTPQPDTHFFMADDLRNSTWSDTSVDPRISIAPSLARASQTQTVYYEDGGVPPVPAQQAFRAQANMVSVKQNSGTTTPAKASPLAISQTASSTASKPVGLQNSSIVAFNAVARPIEIKKSSSKSTVPTLGNLARANSIKSAATAGTEQTGSVFEEKEVVVSKPGARAMDSPVSPPALHSKNSEMSLGDRSMVSAVMPSEGPLGSNSQSPAQPAQSDGLAAMIEAAIQNASSNTRPSSRPGASRQDSGPFSDIHELPSGTP